MTSPFAVSAYREESREVDQLIDALCEASIEFAPITLDEEGLRDGRKYRYASIHSIRRATNEPLARHRLRLFHTYGNTTAEGEYVTTTLQHRSGQFKCSTLLVPPAQDSQERKRLRTLLCRTAIEGLLSITTERDDDGEGIALTAETSQQARNAAAARSRVAHAKSVSELNTLADRVQEFVSDGRMTTAAGEDLLTRVADRRKGIEQATATPKEFTQDDPKPRDTPKHKKASPKPAAPDRGQAADRSKDRPAAPKAPQPSAGTGGRGKVEGTGRS